MESKRNKKKKKGKKYTEKEIRFMVTRGNAWGNWKKEVKRYKFPVLR